MTQPMQQETVTGKKLELESRLGLLANARCTAENRDDFLESLMVLNDDLQRCYQHMRSDEAGDETRAQYEKRILVLEETRLEMLTRIHGNKIKEYAKLPVVI